VVFHGRMEPDELLRFLAEFAAFASSIAKRCSCQCYVRIGVGSDCLEEKCKKAAVIVTAGAQA